MLTRNIDLDQLRISFIDYRLGECALIDEEQIFICGGEGQNDSKKYASTYLIDRHELYSLSNMRRGRYAHGLYYHQESSCVFAFGGITADFTFLESCEQYNFKSNAWTPIRNMKNPKYSTTTCGFRGRVFVGGQSELVEVFTIASKHFTEMKIHSTNKYYINTLSIWRDKLIVFTNKKAKIFNASTYALENKYTFPRMLPLKYTIVVNDMLFSFEFSYYCLFDFTTMRMKLIHSDRYQ